jgi:thiamine phosphate synthase YjbQ (UPF0047 family)
VTPLSPVGALAQRVLDLRTGGRGFREISRKVVEAVASSGVKTGVVKILSSIRVARC